MKKQLFIYTIAAVMGALAFVLNRYISVEIAAEIKITLYALPLILTSVLIDFKVGTIAGIICGLIDQLLFPKFGITVTTPLWMLAPVLWGLIPGLIGKIIKIDDTDIDKLIFRIIIQVTITCLLVTTVNTFVIILDGKIFQYPVKITTVILLIRYSLIIIEGAAYSVLLLGLYHPVKQIIQK